MASLRIVEPRASDSGSALPEVDEELHTRLLAYVMAACEPEGTATRAVSALGALPEIERVELSSSPLPPLRSAADVTLGASSHTPRYLRTHLRAPWTPMGRRRVTALLGLIARVYDREVEIQRLSSEAQTDPLTGLSNRRAFLPFVDQALARAQRSGEDVALMLCDVDHFKRINDTLGHHRGDNALRAVAAALQDVLRPTDISARWGGDEFAVLLSACNAVGARAVANRIRQTLQARAPLRSHRVTLSIGIADAHGLPAGTLAPWQARDMFFRAADEAVYMAKQAGRDTAICHPSCFCMDEIGESDITRPLHLETG